MKKRILSLILAVLMLVSAFPVLSATAAESTQAEDSYDYKSFYVADGLVALFVAYDAKSSGGNVPSWTPVDFYGRTGYEDYLPVSAYALTGTWTAADRAYYSNGGTFDLSSVSAKIGTTWSVQTVSRMDRSAPVPTVDSNYVVTNHADLAAASQWGTLVGGHAYFGPLRASYYNVPTFLQTHLKLFDNYFIQLFYQRASGDKQTPNLFFNTAEYGQSQHTYSWTDASGATTTNAAWTTSWPAPVLEQTVARLGDGVAADGDIAVTFRFTYQFAPGYFSGSTISGRGFTYTSYTPSDSTQLKPIAAVKGTHYSVRVYNKELVSSEIDQNHFADICGFYGLDVNAFAKVSADERASALAGLTSAFAALKLDSVNYAAAKTAAQGIFDEVLYDYTHYSYKKLYVKDGLVALFDGYGAVASSSVSSWTPVDLYGKDGYDDYLPVKAYPLAGSWKTVDGAYYSDGAGTSFNLSEIGAQLGTTWSVQTVSQLVSLNAPIVTIDAQNVVTNYATLASSGKWGDYGTFEYGTSAYGPLEIRFIGAPGYLASNSNTVHNYFMQFYGTNATDGKGAANVFFCNADYGQTMRGLSCTDAAGTTTTVPAWVADFPAAVIEQTVARLGDGTVGATTTAFSWHITYQFAPSNRLGTAITNRRFAHTSYAVNDSTTISILCGKKANNYAVRVYKKDLSLSEIDQNHFADICGFYGLDLEEFAKLSADSKVSVLTDLSTIFATYKLDSVNYATAKTAAQAVLDGVLYDYIHYSYKKLYVTDGLTMLLDAMNASVANSTIDLASGKWYSSLVNTDSYATFVNGDLTTNAWSRRTLNGAMRGVGYYMTNAEAAAARNDFNKKSNTPGLNMGYENLPNENYTVELVLNPYGVMNSTLTERWKSTSLDCQLYHGMSLGPLKAWTFPSFFQGITNQTYDMRWYYSTGNGSSTTISVGGDTSFGVAYPDTDTNLSRMDSVMTYAVTYDVGKNGSADTALWTPTYSFYANGAKTLSQKLAAGKYIAKASVESTWQAFWLMYNYPCTMYSVRVYDRVLTEAERRQNHLADACGFYGLNIDALMDKTDVMGEVLYHLSDAFAEVKLEDAKGASEAAQKLFDETLANCACYSALYAGDLQGLYLAFPSVNTTNLSSGTWMSLVSSDALTLKGTWNAGQNGGIYYNLSGVNTGYGIDLGIDKLPKGDYTIETVGAVKGFTQNADGVTQVTTTSGYGIHPTISSFAFGPLKIHIFGGSSTAASPSLHWQRARFMYGDGDLSWNQHGDVVYKDWGTTHDLWYKDPAVMSLSVTLDWDATAPTFTYVFYKNLTSTTTYAQSNYGGSCPPTAANATQPFRMYTGIGSSVYAIRIYDRVLTSTERAANYAIDLLGFYDMDLSLIAKLETTERAAALAMLNDLCASIPMDESDYLVNRAMVGRKYYFVLNAFGVDMETEAKDDASHLSLYVSDGLTVLLDAVSADSRTVDLAAGKWHSALGNTFYSADLVGGDTYWKRGEGGRGVGYSLTYANRTAAVGLVLGIDALPTASYTIEYVAAFRGIQNADGTRYLDSESTYGYNFENAFVAGPLKQLSFPCDRPSGKDGGMEQRWFYVKTGGWSAVSYTAKLKTSHLRNTAVDAVLTEAITHALAADGSTKYTFYSNEKQIGTFSIAAASYVPAHGTTENLFRLFYSFPGEVYSVRIYDRVLSADEMAQNHFADVIGYFGYDVSSFYDGLTADERQALHASFASIDFSSDRNEVWQLIAPYMLEKEALYVTDGLVFQASAFHTNSTVINTREGKWYDAFSDSYLELVGSARWSRKTDGVGYSLVFAEQDAEVGMLLPSALLSADYTLEITADILGLREDNGGKTGSAETYNHSVDYTLALGALKLKGWNTPVDDSLTYPTKWYYAAGKNATYETASKTFTLSTPIFSPEEDGIRSLAVSRVTADGNDTYELFGNAVSLGSLSAPAATAEGDAFRAFYQMPATVYAVRIYSRALDEEELLQNRFADMVYYYGLDLSAFVDHESKAAVRAEMAEYGFDMTATEAQAVLDMILGNVKTAADLAITYDGLSARLSGANSGIRSLYGINHRLIRALESRYFVAYGAITGIGEMQNGDSVSTIRTTGDLAVSGSYAEGYTAVGSNSACVTVYATDMPAYATGLTINNGNGYAYTTILSDASETVVYYQLGMVYSGFLALTDKETGEQQIVYIRAEGSLFGGEASTYGGSTSLYEIAYYFVQQYQGSNENMYRYNKNERLRHILTSCGMAEEDIRAVADMATLLAARKAELAAVMKTNTADMPVLVAGKDAPLANGEKAIWVQYLPDRDPYATSNDPAAKSVKALYFYYPMNADPADYTDEELVEMGAVRVFAYMAVPTAATAETPSAGMVCVHGGGGHAYADYCLTALRHGYAAIAFDTEGTHRANAEAGVDANTAYTTDPVGHKAKDSFQTAKDAIETQWMYYAVSDAAFANTILRSLGAVDESKVGITGISWGGLVTQITSNYDSRLAFAVPVYLSNYLGYGENTAQFNSIADSFAADLWQDEAVLRQNRVPTLILNSEKDLWADVNSSVRTYEALKENNEHAYLVIKPSLGHSQQEGAPPAEIYRFGNWVNSGYADEYAFIETDRELDRLDGVSYTVTVAVPNTLTAPVVKLHYTTEPITYGASGKIDQTVYEVTLALTAAGTDADGKALYTVEVEVPEEAYLYFLSFYGSSASDAAIVTPYDYADDYKGKVYSSTSIIVVDGGEING